MEPLHLRKNQLHPGILGACSLNPFHQHTSSARSYMFANNLGQMLVFDGGEERYIQTGMEREYAKYTFNVSMPVDGWIVAMIPRYVKSVGDDSIEENPQLVVIYEAKDTRELGMINLVSYSLNHQYFGYRYKHKSGFQDLRVGEFIKAGTVFLESPSVKDNGGYAPGINANVAFASLPATSEDGVLMSVEFAKRLGIKTYETRTIEWGKDLIPLNLYGDEFTYKAYPDIGEPIAHHGILMALRSTDSPELAPVEMSAKALRKVDYQFDQRFYVNGPGGRVVDIRIHHDLKHRNYAEKHTDGQSQKYDDARRVFLKKIYDKWNEYYKRLGDDLRITPELHRLVLEAGSVITEGPKNNISKIYRKAPLDEYQVEIVVEYDIKPGVGFKLTDTHGGKGVVVQMELHENMPRDKDGNIADLVFDGGSTISRTNTGRLYEHLITGSARDTHKRLCAMLGIAPQTNSRIALHQLAQTPMDTILKGWDYLMSFYKTVSPRQHGYAMEVLDYSDKVSFLSEIVDKPVIGVFFPTDNEIEDEEMAAALYKNFPPCCGPITYVGNSGKRVTTKENVEIASLYILLLEKTGDDWSSVASGKFNHYGTLAQLTRVDKYSKPAHAQNIRGDGEAERRIRGSNCGTEFDAEQHDRNSNPATHRHLMYKLLTAKEPGNIENLVDRKEIPLGGAKPLMILHHLAQVSGFEFIHKPYDSGYDLNTVNAYIASKGAGPWD